jgi:hypothetical protein
LTQHANQCAQLYLSGNPVLANISQISGTESNGNQDTMPASYTAQALQPRFAVPVGHTYLSA